MLTIKEPSPSVNPVTNQGSNVKFPLSLTLQFNPVRVEMDKCWARREAFTLKSTLRSWVDLSRSEFR